MVLLFATGSFFLVTAWYMNRLFKENVASGAIDAEGNVPKAKDTRAERRNRRRQDAPPTTTTTASNQGTTAVQY